MKTREQRFEEKVDRSGGPDACHPWRGGRGQAGQPTCHIGGGKTGSARRVAWELYHPGVKLTRNQWVRVICGTPHCLNPVHLALRAAFDDAPRFWENVQKGDGCWEWQGYRCHRGGYGVFKRAGNRPLRAHRVSYEMAHGVTLTPDQVVMHKCDNPPCVNPAHLSLGTHGDNHRDMVAKGRHPTIKPKTTRVA